LENPAPTGIGGRCLPPATEPANHARVRRPARLRRASLYLTSRSDSRTGSSDSECAPGRVRGIPHRLRERPATRRLAVLCPSWSTREHPSPWNGAALAARLYLRADPHPSGMDPSKAVSQPRGCRNGPGFRMPALLARALPATQASIFRDRDRDRNRDRGERGVSARHARRASSSSSPRQPEHLRVARRLSEVVDQSAAETIFSIAFTEIE
jgi:hypothetical protein